MPPKPPNQSVSELDRALEKNAVSVRDQLNSLKKPQYPGLLDGLENKYWRSKKLYENSVVSLQQGDLAELSSLLKKSKLDLKNAETKAENQKYRIDTAKSELKEAQVKKPKIRLSVAARDKGKQVTFKVKDLEEKLVKLQNQGAELDKKVVEAAREVKTIQTKKQNTEEVLLKEARICDDHIRNQQKLEILHLFADVSKKVGLDRLTFDKFKNSWAEYNKRLNSGSLDGFKVKVRDMNGNHNTVKLGNSHLGGTHEISVRMHMAKHR